MGNVSCYIHIFVHVHLGGRLTSIVHGKLYYKHLNTYLTTWSNYFMLGDDVSRSDDTATVAAAADFT